MSRPQIEAIHHRQKSEMILTSQFPWRPTCPFPVKPIWDGIQTRNIRNQLRALGS